MKITCSILCYNYGRYIAKAIESCLNQEQKDYELEILVIDDGSTDETPEVCQKYQNKIKVLRSQNQGFGASLDKAIREASGDYVCLLDADDYFSSEKIITLLPYICIGYLYIQHQQYFIEANGKAISSITHRGGNTSTLCLNRVAALPLLPVQNEIFFHPLKSAGHGIELDEPLSFYRFHNSSMIRNKGKGVWYAHLAEVTHALADQLLIMSQKPPSWTNSHDLNKISKEYLSLAKYQQMEAALQLGQRNKALLACLGILLAAVSSRTGLTIWHCKVIIRGVLGKAIN